MEGNRLEQRDGQFPPNTIVSSAHSTVYADLYSSLHYSVCILSLLSNLLNSAILFVSCSLTGNSQLFKNISKCTGEVCRQKGNSILSVPIVYYIQCRENQLYTNV